MDVAGTKRLSLTGKDRFVPAEACASSQQLVFEMNKLSKNRDGVYVGYFAVGLHNDGCTLNAAALRESAADATLPQRGSIQTLLFGLLNHGRDLKPHE